MIAALTESMSTVGGILMPTAPAFRAAEAITGEPDYETAMKIDESLDLPGLIETLKSVRSLLEFAVFGSINPARCAEAIEKVNSALKKLGVE